MQELLPPNDLSVLYLKTTFKKLPMISPKIKKNNNNTESHNIKH